MKSKTKVMLLSVVMAAVFGVCNLGGVARLSTVSRAEDATGITLNKTETTIDKGETDTLTATLTPDGATGTVTWESADPAIATVSDGTVTGVKAGTTIITAKTSDTVIATCDVTVRPIITTGTTLPAGTEGVSYNETLAAEGADSYTWSQTGSLPNGLTFNNGTISGTPVSGSAGDYSITVKVTAESINSTETTFSLTINAAATAPTITTESLPSGTVGTAYTGTLAASGTTPITWSSDSGTLPTGLTLNNDGTFSGTPSVAGSFTFTVKASNSAGDVTKSFTVVINPATIEPATNLNLTPLTGTLGTLYEAQLSADSTAPVTWEITGLPSWLTQDKADSSKISGTPPLDTKTFSFYITATAINGAANPAKKTFNISFAKASNGVVLKEGSTVITSPLKMGTGEKKTITAEVDTTSSNKTVSWSLVNSNVIKAVGRNGGAEVTALKAGTAVLTATSNADGNLVGSITIIVEDVPVTGITLSPSTATISPKEEITIATTFTPANATKKEVTWNSDNTAVATVNKNGVVTGVAAGTANITATSTDGTNITSSAAVITVEADKPLITTKELPSGEINAKYSAALKASANGAGTLEWSITGLPDGMTFSKTTGAISGTPKESGNFQVTVTIKGSGNGKTDTKKFTLVIGDPEATTLLKNTNNGVTDASANNLLDYMKSLKEYKDEEEVSIEMTVNPLPSNTTFTGRAVMLDEVYKHFAGVQQKNLDWRFVDVSIVKTVNGTDTTLKTTNPPIEIELTVDSAMTQRTPIVVRYHDSKAEVFTRLETQPKAADFKDGTYYYASGKIYIYSSKYSYFTIAWPTVNVYTVSFNTGTDGSDVADMIVETGGKIPAPTEPTREGYVFDGWYSDSSYAKLWNLSTDTVTGDMTLYAKWTTEDGTSANSGPRSRSGNTDQEESTVRGSRTGDNKEAERIARLLAIMTTTWIVLFNALAFGKKRRQRIRRK